MEYISNNTPQYCNQLNWHMKTMALMFIGALSLSWGSVQAKTPLKGLGIKGGVWFDYPVAFPPDVTGGIFAYCFPCVRWQPVVIGGDILVHSGVYPEQSDQDLYNEYQSDQDLYNEYQSDQDLYNEYQSDQDQSFTRKYELHFRPKIGFDFRVKKKGKHFWQWLFPATSYASHSWQWFIPSISYAPHFILPLPLPSEFKIPDVLWLGGCLTWQLPYRLQLEADVGKIDNDVWKLSDGWYFKVTFGYRC